MTAALLVAIVDNQGRWSLLPWMRTPTAMAPRTAWRVAVATTFVAGSESIDMLAETLSAIVAIDYPHDTWVLDEEDDERVTILCDRLGAKHFSRKNFPGYQTAGEKFRLRTKYGNYNAWLYEIAGDRYDVVTTIDPDHVPQPTFLSEVLGYFEDPQIGYVQVAPAYYNREASFIARGAAEEVYEYHSSIQMASFGMGYTVAIGSHTTHRMTALMQMDGFPGHDAEDLLLTLQCSLRWL